MVATAYAYLVLTLTGQSTAADPRAPIHYTRALPTAPIVYGRYQHRIKTSAEELLVSCSVTVYKEREGARVHGDIARFVKTDKRINDFECESEEVVL